MARLQKVCKHDLELVTYSKLMTLWFVAYTIACSSSSMEAYLISAAINVLYLFGLFSNCGQVAVGLNEIPDHSLNLSP